MTRNLPVFTLADINDPLRLPAGMYFSPEKIYALRDAVLELAIALPAPKLPTRRQVEHLIYLFNDFRPNKAIEVAMEMGVERSTIDSIITLLKD